MRLLGVKRLPAGQYLKINDKEQKFTSFWKVPHPSVEKEYSEKFYLEKLDYLLNKSVKGQLISDVPLGVFIWRTELLFAFCDCVKKYE